jgi:hypothetical protein
MKLALTILLLACGLLTGTARAGVVDDVGKTITLKIVYVSAYPGAARQNLVHAFKKYGGDTQFTWPAANELTGTSRVPVQLAAVRGYAVTLELYQAPSDPRAETARLAMIEGADVIVFIADATPTSSLTNNQSLAALLRDLRAIGGNRLPAVPIVFQYIGLGVDAPTIDELDERFSVGDRPSYAAELVSGLGVIDTLKAASKLGVTAVIKPGPAPRKVVAPVQPKPSPY